jgi:hypothetical protein
MKRGKGPFLYDHDGNRYVDFSLDGGSLNLGHAHPRVTSVMKSWLSRGYGADPLTASVTASHQALSKRLWNLVWGQGEKPDIKRWNFLYATSPTEAMSLYFKHCGADARGAVILKPPFADVRSTEFEGGGGKAGQALTISDETEFLFHSMLRSSPEHMFRLRGRIVGNWAAAGLPFGCLMLDASLFSVPNAAEQAIPLAGSLPLYLVKAASRSIDLREQLGGIPGLLEKQRALAEDLDVKFFALKEGVVFMRYEELRALLLRAGILFPVSPREPLSVSYAHESDLLAGCARQINLLFARFFR